MLILPPKVEIFSILAKNPGKIEIKLPIQCPISHGTKFCLKYFVRQFFITYFRF